MRLNKAQEKRIKRAVRLSEWSCKQKQANTPSNSKTVQNGLRAVIWRGQIMAQSRNFWKIHGENGLKFKTLIIDTNMLDKKVGFPINEINNTELLEKYFIAVRLRKAMNIIDYQYRHNKGNPITKEIFEMYSKSLSDYKRELPKYHKQR